jgi:FlaA1/EpsC-like NDP-sugar epimerase
LLFLPRLLQIFYALIIIYAARLPYNATMRGFLGNPRRVLIVVHDLVVTALAILATLYVRFGDGQNGGLDERYPWLVIILPCYLAYAALIYWYFHLYMAKWRFASLPDLRNIFRAVTVLAISLLVLDYVLLYPSLYGTFFFGKVTIALYWFLQMFFLGGPRIAYRLFRLSRTQQHVKGLDAMPTLIVGRAADAEVLLRAIESGRSRMCCRLESSRRRPQIRIIPCAMCRSAAFSPISSR